MLDWERDIYQNMVHRAKIREVLNSDGDKLQQVRASGYKNEEIESHRAQTWGFSSMPMDGSLGYAINLQGRKESAIIIGGEHPDHRPTGQRPGESMQYDHQGQQMHIQDAGIRNNSPNRVISNKVADNAAHRVQVGGWNVITVKTKPQLAIFVKDENQHYKIDDSVWVAIPPPPADPTR